MSITGESFDYGPYGFIPTYEPHFIAAYFDYSGRYCYTNQPGMCKLNLNLLQEPLRAVVNKADMETGLSKFDEYYHLKYLSLILNKLGFVDLEHPEAEELAELTIQFLHESQVGYHQFFYEMARTFSIKWRDELGFILEGSELAPPLGSSPLFDDWRLFYHNILNDYEPEEIEEIARNLTYYNPKTVLLRPVIEETWEAIVQEDNWQPFYDLVKRLQNGE
jgi:serine/tyrosine/threonine adenylyltransferase